MAEREKLSDSSLQSFLQKLESDAALKSEVVDKIRKNGVTPVLAEFFILDDKQNQNLNRLTATDDLQQQLTGAILAALGTGGRIRLTQPDFNRIEPRSSVHVGVGVPGVGTVDVDVECQQ